MFPSIEVSVTELDPLILEAAREVDGALLEWGLSLSPRERLRACSNATTALGKFANVPFPVASSIWRP